MHVHEPAQGLTYINWAVQTTCSHIKVHTYAQHRNWVDRLKVDTLMVLYMLYADPAHHVLSRTMAALQDSW